MCLYGTVDPGRQRNPIGRFDHLIAFFETCPLAAGRKEQHKKEHED
jgi:hypothetical protein